MAGQDKLTSSSIPISTKGLSGGLNSTASALTVSPNESSKLLNIDFDKFGSFMKRNGYVNLNTTSLNGGAQVTGLRWFEMRSGTKYLVSIVGDCAYSTNLSSTFTDISGNNLFDDDDLLVYDDDDSVFTQDNITITADHLCASETFLDRAIFTNGEDTPFYWDGTNPLTEMTMPTDITRPKWVKQFCGYLFFANCEVGGVRQGSRLNWSNINTIDAWTDSDFAYISWNDGQQINGLEVLGDRLVIFKDRSIWIGQFTGDVDVPFQFQKTQSHVGCVSGFSIQNVANGLVFLSEDGVYFFDGNSSQKLSYRVNTTLYANNAVRNQYAMSIYQKYKNKYWITQSLSGSTETDQVVTWDDYNNAFSIYDGMHPSVMCVAYSGGLEIPIFGDYDGMIYKADTGTDDYPYTDTGGQVYDDSDPILLIYDDDDTPIIVDPVIATAINGYFYTKWLDYDDLVNVKGIGQIDVFYQINTATLSVTYAYDFEEADTYTLPINTSGGSDLWDVMLWDVGKWARSGGNHSRLDITSRGRLVRIGFKNNVLSETFRVDGIGQLVHVETNQ